MTAEPLLVPVGGAAVVGLTLVLSELRWFRRPRLTDRLAPYAPTVGPGTRSGVLSVASFRDVIAPLAQTVGARLARVFGVHEDVGTRLRRIHSPIDAASFRVRQLGWSGAALLAGGGLAAGAGASPAPALLLVFGAPLLVFLVQEQHLAEASTRWQRGVFLELPVVAEQLGMLLAAGWSLTSAIERVAERGRGACALDLRRVSSRISQGVAETDALREWGRLARVDALDRLIAVLALERESTDVGRLVSDEARTIRRDAQRELMETIEKRNQQVWIPVTVAALIPGVLLMGVPFMDALSLFSTR